MFAARDHVEVTAGMSKGMRGVVEELTPHRYDGETVYSVRFETGYVRPIRESYLRELRVPAASSSDGDVLSPLRNNVSG